MSAVRIKLSGQKSTVHLIGRIVGAERLLDDTGKETLVKMLWKMAAFCGMEVITYFGAGVAGAGAAHERWGGPGHASVCK